MAQEKRTINLTELLLECIGKPDPMLNMLEWLCAYVGRVGGADKILDQENRRSPCINTKIE
jgi:hypothetical protein